MKALILLLCLTSINTFSKENKVQYLEIDEGRMWTSKTSYLTTGIEKLKKDFITKEFHVLELESAMGKINLRKGQIKDLKYVNLKNKGDCYNYPDSFIEFKYDLLSKDKDRNFYGFVLFDKDLELIDYKNLPKKVSSTYKAEALTPNRAVNTEKHTMMKYKNVNPRAVLHSKSKNIYYFFEIDPQVEPLGLNFSRVDGKTLKYQYIESVGRTPCGF